MSGANDVLPVCTKMNILEKKMEDMIEQISRFTKGQLLNPNVAAPYANAVQSGARLVGVHPLATPRRGKIDSTSSFTAGSFANPAPNAFKRKHGESTSNVNATSGAPIAPGTPQLGGIDVPKLNSGLPTPNGGRNNDKGKPSKRKVCFGSSKITVSGRPDWAAPVEVFVSNTSPDICEDDVKEILKLCADDAMKEEGNQHLKEFIVKEAKCLTRPDIENPRTKCWRVSVPFKFKEYIHSDIAYPLGWCHRPYYPPKSKAKEDSSSEQLAKRSRGDSM